MTKSIDLNGPLPAISPLDGRYSQKTAPLKEFVSEYALIKTRVEIEVKYLLHLSKNTVVRNLKLSEKKKLESLYKNFTLQDAKDVKDIEKETRHDVKAVEKFIRVKTTNSSLRDLQEFIHFGLTSEDINNISYRLMFMRAMNYVIKPELRLVLKSLGKMADANADLPILARTHGQRAVPTTLGKELFVFLQRLCLQEEKLEDSLLCGKLNGAVGNYNALFFVYPKKDWIKISEEFLHSLGLSSNLATTQINTYEDITNYMQVLHSINSVLIDFNQDMWRYISDDWFHQKFKKGEVGSSTMPQKVNPIDFENSEGNLGIANAILEFFIRKLPISRLQRDLTDSTVIRNISTVLGYELVALKSLQTGLSRIEVNKDVISKHLHADWSILTEGVQTYLRSIGVSDSYVLVASLSKGKEIREAEWFTWIEGLPIEKKHKEFLLRLTPETYTGLANEIVRYKKKK